MENSRCCESEFEDFCTKVSKSLNQLSSGLKSGPRSISFKWVQKCLEMLREVNTAFMKLAMGIDHPMIKWVDDDGLIEGFLNYSLNLLDLLNSISYSLSQLRHAWLCASHALTLQTSEVADRLREIRFRHLYKQFAFKELKEKQDHHPSCHENEEQVIQRAILIVRGIGYWVCGIILTSLSGDSSPYLEMRKSADRLDFPDIAAIDAIVAEEKGLASEIREANLLMGRILAAVDGGEVAAAAADELKTKLEEIDGLLDGLGKETDGIFSEIMSARNKLMECLRRRIY